MSFFTPSFRAPRYTPPTSPEDALADADRNLEYKSGNKDGMADFDGYACLVGLIWPYVELIDAYLNGDRTLSNERLSYLILSSDLTALPTPPLTLRPTDSTNDPSEPICGHDLLICATHFVGDGMALHRFANEFFGLLGSDKTLEGLETMLREEWEKCCRPHPEKVCSH